MKVALVSPPALTHKYNREGEVEIFLLGFFHQPRYQDSFLTSSKTKYRILNCGPLFGPRQAHAVATMIGADEIILPNQTGSMKRTMEELNQWKSWLSESFYYQLVVENFIGLPSMLTKYIWENYGSKIHTLGLPANLQQYRFQYQDHDSPYTYDLLGTYTREELDVWAIPPPLPPLSRMRYLHTSRPIYMGQAGLDILDDEWIQRPNAYMKSHKHTPKVYDNIRRLENYIGDTAHEAQR